MSTGVMDTIRLLDEAASVALGVSRSRVLPTDLASLGTRLGVVSVERRAIVPEGFVESGEEAGQYRIVLRSDRPETRSRFSWAHELGHLILDRLSGNLASNLGRRYRECSAVSASLDEEAKADYLAGMLLLPREAIWPVVADCVSLGAMLDLSRQAQVSFATALIRSVSITNATCVAFLIRSYTDEKSRLACLWSRSSHRAGVVPKEELLNRIDITSEIHTFVRGASPGPTAFAVCRGRTVGRLELYRTRFDDKISVFGVFNPFRPVH